MWQLMIPILAQSEGDVDAVAPTATLQNGAADGTPAPTGGGGGGFGDGFLFLLLMIMVLMVVMTMAGGRKEKKRRAAMIAALKKGDKVQTAGGILGTVVEVRESEVVVKVDENANTRLRFARSAIQAVLEEQKS